MLISHCKTSKSWRNTHCSTKKECLDAPVIRGFRLLHGSAHLYIYISLITKKGAETYVLTATQRS